MDRSAAHNFAKAGTSFVKNSGCTDREDEDEDEDEDGRAIGDRSP
jgi:hypothetical protein